MDNKKSGAIIFIGGIHCAGKSVFSSRLVTRFDVQHVTASALIKQRVALKNDKSVTNVQHNQDVLIEAVEELPRTSSTVLLDGHYCLINKNYQIEKVPLETFKQLNPKGLIVVCDRPDIIRQRLHERDGTEKSEKAIAEFQRSEKEWASEIARELKVPLIQFMSPDADEVGDPELVRLFET